MKTTCFSCNAINEFTSAFQDELGWHVICPICDSSYDIDIELFLISNGIKVKYWGNGVGIVDGNDADITEQYEDINYYVCPVEFTHKKVWSDHYNMFLRSEFEIVV